MGLGLQSDIQGVPAKCKPSASQGGTVPSTHATPRDIHSAMSADLVTLMFLVTAGGEGTCYWHLVSNAKDAAKHPSMHRTAPNDRNDPARSTDSAGIGSPHLKR